MVSIHIVPVVTYFIISGVCLICFVSTSTCFHRWLRLFIYFLIIRISSKEMILSLSSIVFSRSEMRCLSNVSISLEFCGVYAVLTRR